MVSDKLTRMYWFDVLLLFILKYLLKTKILCIPTILPVNTHLSIDPHHFAKSFRPLKA